MADFLNRWRDREIHCVDLDLDYTEPLEGGSLQIGIVLSAEPSAEWVVYFAQVVESDDPHFDVEFQAPNMLIVSRLAPATAVIEQTFAAVSRLVDETNARFARKSAAMLAVVQPVVEAQKNIRARLSGQR